MDNFLLHIKSTVDKLGSDLASTLDVEKKVDLDDIVNTAELLSSGDEAVVWEVGYLSENPIDPLYDLVFSIGIKMTGDPSNYNMMTLLGQVQSVFPKSVNFLIKDYSGDTTDPTIQGDMTIVDVSVDPQQFDRVSSIRLVSVRCKVVRSA